MNAKRLLRIADHLLNVCEIYIDLNNARMAMKYFARHRHYQLLYLAEVSKPLHGVS